MKTMKRLLAALMGLFIGAFVQTFHDGNLTYIRYKGRNIPVPAGGASGDTDTATLEESLPHVIAEARIVREQLGQDFISTVDRKTLPMGTGRNWNEIDLGKISAQAVGEKQQLDNPQMLIDTLLSIEPTRIGVHLVITQEASHYVSQNVAAQWGGLMENANRRYKDRKGLDVYDGATVTGGGSGTTLNSGVVSAMVAQIQGDTDESALETEEIYAIVHSFQLHDVRTELTSGVGTYVLTPGASQEAFTRGQSSIERMGGATVKKNNNVRIDSVPNAHGGVHAKSGIVLVEVTGKQRAFTETPGNRGGDKLLWLYDWFGFGERSAGNLVKRLLTDATAPTSG